jgi:hypothetical protein
VMKLAQPDDLVVCVMTVVMRYVNLYPGRLRVMQKGKLSTS